jgi:hypothetical protein
MSIPASTIIASMGVMLNDVAQNLYTNTVLIPHIQQAVLELQDECVSNSVQLLQAETSEEHVVAITGTVLPTPPTDMLVPIELFERPWGSTNIEDFEPMVHKEWLPDEAQDTTLRWWVYQRDAIAFLGATTDRGVKMHYWKLITNISGSSDPIPTIKAQNFLAFRGASMAARFVGENDTRADYLDSMAQMALDKFLTISVKAVQDQPARRIPFSRKFRRYIR